MSGGMPPSGPRGPSGPPPGGPSGPNGPDPRSQPPAGGSSGSYSSQQPVYQSTYGPTSTYMPYQYYWYVQPNCQLLFLATLEFPDLSKLINDPI